jgi:hypothetical protein
VAPAAPAAAARSELQVPIFDFGEARLRQAGEAYIQAVNLLAENAVNVRSQAREDLFARVREVAGDQTKINGEPMPVRPHGRGN